MTRRNTAENTKGNIVGKDDLGQEVGQSRKVVMLMIRGFNK